MKAGYEIEIKKLNCEISRIKDQLDYSNVERHKNQEEIISKAEIEKRNFIN